MNLACVWLSKRNAEQNALSRNGYKQRLICFVGIRALFSSGLRYKALCQPIDRVPLTVADDVAVNPEGQMDRPLAASYFMR